MIDALLAALLAGIDPSIVTLLPGALAGLPPAKVAWLIHGEALTCEGAWLVDVAACAGLPTGKDASGAALTQVVVAEAADGYRVVFSLGELDRGNTPVLVANACNGKPLDAADGLYRLLVAGDARGARSVRHLVRLRIVALP